MSERTVQRVGAKVVVRSIDNAGCTMRALTVTSKLRLQGSALAAASARPDVQSALTDVSWRTGAGHVTGVSVVCGEPEPELTSVRGTAEGEVVWQGSDGALDQHLEEFMPEGPQRARLDWKNLGKYAPDGDDPRTMPMPADRATLRRPGRVSSRRGYLRPPLPVDRPPTPGKISESAPPSECALMPSSTPTAAADNGTRCSAPAFIRDAGTRHSPTSRSTSPHVAPRASPDRTAVSAVKLIAALTTGLAPDASTASSAAGTCAFR